MSFLWLLFAHLIADYPLQGDFLANVKGKNHIVLATHAGIWTGCIATAGYLLGFSIDYLDIFLLFSVHAILDYFKAANKGIYKKLDALKSGLLLDQSLHVLQILLFMWMNN
ncbi:DUF3307 domain-containing protein [Bacillus thuringiensis]|uniref:DUF3307 domain-containing protein n=1 Tax=Bacillus thuringiensis TaxID=1428 RepID=UPI0037D97783